MIFSSSQSLVPLGVFSSILAGAILSFFLGAEVVKLLLFEAESKPAPSVPNAFATLLMVIPVVIAVRKIRGVVVAVGRAREADLKRLAGVTIRIHVF